MSDSSGTQDFDYLLKILPVGDHGIGKTSLILRYVDDAFSDRYISTIGVDFRLKTITVDGFVVRLQIWDCSGAKRFHTTPNSYYRGTKGMVILYDITDKDSFDRLSYWLGDIQENAPEDVCKVVVGTKCDLEDERKVTREEGEKYAESVGALFFEVSAKTGENVDALFTALVKEILKKTIRNN